MADPIETPPGFTAALVFDDPTPNAVILNRINRRPLEIAGTCTDLNREEANDFIDLVMLISRKMVSVWKHLQTYQAEQTRLREQFADPAAQHHVYSQELFEEFDVFAVQIKSTLDHVVKVMRPMLGRKWTMYTFAGKGEGVLASLKNNTPRKHTGRVKSMEHFLFNEKHMDWLAAIIDSRDRMNHCQEGGLKIEKFAVFRNPDGTIHVPMWSDEQELAKAMDAIWSNFFHFVEDFIMLALHFRVLDGKFSMFRKEEPLTSPKSSWAVMTKADGDALIKKLGAIFRSPLGLEMVDSLAAAKSFENVRLFRATAFWNDQEDVLADGFRRREPEEFRGAAIPRGDDAIRLLLTMHRRRIQQSPPRARADRCSVLRYRSYASHRLASDVPSPLVLAQRISVVAPHHSWSRGSSPQHRRREREPFASRVGTFLQQPLGR